MEVEVCLVLEPKRLKLVFGSSSCYPVSLNDQLWVHLIQDYQLLSLSEQFSTKHSYSRRPISDDVILSLADVDYNLGCRILHNTIF